MTNDDLKTMQAWPIERKIKVSQTRIMEWYIHYDGNVYVSFSGGKDSTVLLDLVRRIYPDVIAAFVNTGLEYPEIRQFVKTIDNVLWLRPEMSFKEVIEKHGYPVVSKQVAETVRQAKKSLHDDPNANTVRVQQLRGELKDKYGNKSMYNCEKWGFLLNAPFDVSEQCCEIMKKRPFKKAPELQGKNPITGVMASESRRRKQNWLDMGCNAFDRKDGPMSMPLSFWTEQDILKYLKITGIPYSSVYGDIEEESQMTMLEPELHTTGAKRTGCMFCMFGIDQEKSPNRFERMKKDDPKRYNLCINDLGCGKVLDYIGAPY